MTDPHVDHHDAVGLVDLLAVVTALFALDYPDLVLILLVELFAGFSFAGCIRSVAYADVFAKEIPAQRRGRFIRWKQLIGYTLAIGAEWVVAWILLRDPSHGAAGVCITSWPASLARTAEGGKRRVSASRLRSLSVGCIQRSVLSTLVSTPGNAYTGTVEFKPAVAPRYERVLSPGVMHRLRLVFRSMNRGMVLMWRLGLGRWADAWPSVAGRILVVEHRGRRTGTRYLAPLNFTSDNRSRYCLAAFGPEADWYRNVFAAQRAVLWLPDGRWTAVATDVTGEAGSRDRIRQVLIDSGFAARVFGLNPGVMTDVEIDAATSGYRLVRFELIDRCDESPADLAAAWVAIAAAVAAIGAGVVLRRRRS